MTIAPVCRCTSQQRMMEGHSFPGCPYYESKSDRLRRMEELDHLLRLAADMEAERNELKWLLRRIGKAFRNHNEALDAVASEPHNHENVAKYTKAHMELYRVLGQASKV